MDCQKKFFPETEFGGFDRFDSTISFYLRVNALLEKSDVVLDVGCGQGSYKDDPIEIRRDFHSFHGKVQKVIGLDLDPNAEKNPFIDEFHLLDDANSAWPISDHSIDIIVTDWTLEHISDPDVFFSEIKRVLKRGGYFCARTTNSWGFVAISARIIPERFHSKVIQSIQKTRKEEDVFPTHYSCNSIPLLRRKLKEHGFSGTVIGYSDLPGYLNFSCIAYYLGYLYERLMPQFFRHILMIFAVKE